MPPPVGGDPYQVQPAPPPQPYVAPAPVAPVRPPVYYSDPPAREAPRYVPPSRSYDAPHNYDAPRNDYAPEVTPPMYDERREQPRFERERPPSRKLQPEGDPWSENQRDLQKRERGRIPEPDAPRGPRGNVCAYRVRPGDTLTDIAEERYGVSGPRTIAKIVSVNPGLDPDRIYAGQTLLLPKSLACGARPEEPPPCHCAPVRREHARECDHGYNNALQLMPISTQTPR